MTTQTRPLIDTAWLADNLTNPKLRIIDVRWKFREENGKGVAYDDRSEFQAEHIPGAVYVGMSTELANSTQNTPDMMLGPEDFGERMRELGVSNDSHVVVYDDSGLPLASARLWWALSHYGHKNVQVLDGGLQQWKLEGRPTETGDLTVEHGDFEPTVQSNWIARKADVLDAMGKPGVRIVDFLPNNLFRGDGVHTWGGRSGHIPSAVNIPAISNIDPDLAHIPISERAAKLKERGSFKLADHSKLLKHYQDKGIQTDDEVIAYCGRGIAASCGLLALRQMGFEKSRLYDGSWAEWSADEILPVETS
ncbi:3-mercaptopyruvate sulfurtransferase [Ruegeria atlantica]|uniref:3-mercaptopyruvate sulfurtransferase n=2 Tax=Ruegeria atlantica TaxID=81569 RepID=A0A0P1EMR8_9RHOB|nr:3-mercaptopyruvate sulfurtransferase [Ruegeria atlantica]